MSDKLKDGEIIGVRKIIRYVCNLGSKELYQVECVNCGDTRTSPRSVIEKQKGCHRCFTSKVRAYSPKRLAAIKKEQENG